MFRSCFGGMPAKHEPPIVEKFNNFSDLCTVGVCCFQGRQNHMEDRYSVITNINRSDVSMYAIFDGHAGSFAAEYAANIIMPCISEKIGYLIDIIRVRQTRVELKKRLEKERKIKLIREGKANMIDDPPPKSIDEDEENAGEDENENDPLMKYLSKENVINYEKLLYDEILSSDKALLERMGKAALFCGTTANIVVVDLTSKLIVCANVGDSRAIMCDARGSTCPLSEDHKPDLPQEMARIRQSGGHISNKSGCWRVDGTLACSRTLGDYPLKMKKFIIADPDIKTFRFKDFKNLPKFIIIGSDGLFDVFKNQELCDFTKNHLKENTFGARSLMKKAYARMSGDNISVIVIKFTKPKPKKILKSSYDLTSNTYEWLK